jgi:hypothetical protein
MRHDCEFESFIRDTAHTVSIPYDMPMTITSRATVYGPAAAGSFAFLPSPIAKMPPMRSAVPNTSDHRAVNVLVKSCGDHAF